MVPDGSRPFAHHPPELASRAHLLPPVAVPHVWEHIKGGLIFITAESFSHGAAGCPCTTACCIQPFVRAAELNQSPIMGESRFLLGDLDLPPDPCAE